MAQYRRRMKLAGNLDFNPMKPKSLVQGMLIEMATLLKKTKNTLNKMSMSMHFLLPLAEHSWLQNAEKAANVPLGDVVKSRLKQFSTMNRFKRRALRVIADHLSTEEVEGIKEVFKMIDMDNDGIVSCEELKSGLAKFGTQLVESEVQMLIEAFFRIARHHFCIKLYHRGCSSSNIVSN